MIRTYLTSWTYRQSPERPQYQEAVNPILLAVDANPEYDIEYRVVGSNRNPTTGEFINANCVVVLRGSLIPDAVDNLAGVKRIPTDKLNLTVGDISAQRRKEITDWITANTGVDTKQFTLSSTLKQVLWAIIQDINPSFTTFGEVIEALDIDWE